MLKVTRCEFVHNLPCAQVSNRLTDLEAENAKLRELVSDLWTHCPADRYYCSLCEYGNDDGSECKLANRMRELGIEVN